MNVLPPTPPFSTFGIVEISTCQGINDSRLSVVCEAFFKCCVARRSLDEADAEAVWQP